MKLYDFYALTKDCDPTVNLEIGFVESEAGAGDGLNVDAECIQRGCRTLIIFGVPHAYAKLRDEAAEAEQAAVDMQDELDAAKDENTRLRDAMQEAKDLLNNGDIAEALEVLQENT